MYTLPLPTKQQVKNLGERLGRLFSGFAASFLLVLLPLIIAIIIEGWIPIERPSGSFWTTDILVEFILIMLFVGFAAVYTLRLLYWLKTAIPYHWNQHTPPYNHNTQNHTGQGLEDVESLFKKAERQTGRWLLYGFALFFGMLALIFTLLWIIDQAGRPTIIEEMIINGPDEDGVLVAIFNALSTLPLLGELTEFKKYLPGDSFLERVILNVPAVFFAVAIRNFAFMFENLDYIIQEATFRRPNRFTFYLFFSTTAIILLGIGIMLVVSVHLVTFG